MLIQNVGTLVEYHLVPVYPRTLEVRQLVVPNVPLIQTVHPIRLVCNKDAETLVLVRVHLRLSAVLSIMFQLVPVLLVTPEILSPTAS